MSLDDVLEFRVSISSCPSSVRCRSSSPNHATFLEVVPRERGRSRERKKSFLSEPRAVDRPSTSTPNSSYDTSSGAERCEDDCKKQLECFDASKTSPTDETTRTVDNLGEINGRKNPREAEIVLWPHRRMWTCPQTGAVVDP